MDMDCLGGEMEEDDEAAGILSPVAPSVGSQCIPQRFADEENVDMMWT